MITNNPKISVIIPAYNVDRYIHECLNSVINQTLKDIEIIIINDASTDKTLNIVEEFAKKNNNIKIISHNINKGISISRNEGLKYAKGEYVHFLDSDDYIDINMYEELYKLAKCNNSSIVLFAYYKFLNETNFYKTSYLHKSLLKNTSGLLLSLKQKQIALKSGITVWNKLYSLNFIKQLNLKFVTNMLYEDIPFTFKAISLSKNISYINKPFYYYRQRRNSIMASSIKFNDIVRSLVITYNELIYNNIFNDYANFFVKKMLNTYISFYKKVNKTKRKDFFKQIQKSLKMVDTSKITNKKIKLKHNIMLKMPYNIFNILIFCKLL